MIAAGAVQFQYGAKAMIDPDREQILTLAEAAKYVAETFGQRKPSANTMARWCIQGLRGRTLESLKCGHTRKTSKEAVVRFFQRLAEPKHVAPQPMRADVKRLALVEQELAARGIG